MFLLLTSRLFPSSEYTYLQSSQIVKNSHPYRKMCIYRYCLEATLGSELSVCLKVPSAHKRDNHIMSASEGILLFLSCLRRLLLWPLHLPTPTLDPSVSSRRFNTHQHPVTARLLTGAFHNLSHKAELDIPSPQNLQTQTFRRVLRATLNG